MGFPVNFEEGQTVCWLEELSGGPRLNDQETRTCGTIKEGECAEGSLYIPDSKSIIDDMCIPEENLRSPGNIPFTGRFSEDPLWICPDGALEDPFEFFVCTHDIYFIDYMKLMEGLNETWPEETKEFAARLHNSGATIFYSSNSSCECGETFNVAITSPHTGITYTAAISSHNPQWGNGDPFEMVNDLLNVIELGAEMAFPEKIEGRYQREFTLTGGIKVEMPCPE